MEGDAILKSLAADISNQLEALSCIGIPNGPGGFNDKSSVDYDLAPC
jgi:hypothetical protein